MLLHSIKDPMEMTRDVDRSNLTPLEIVQQVQLNELPTYKESL